MVGLQNKWGTVTPSVEHSYYPSIPTPEEVSLYEKLFKKASANRKNLNVLILGATPSLRDLASKNKSNIYVADTTLELIQSMGRLMKQKDDEAIINGNWLNLPLKDHFFDVVLADFAFEQLLPDEQDILFREIKRLLKRDGFYLGRSRLMVNLPLKSFSELAAEYRNGKLSWWDFRYLSAYFNKGLLKWYDPCKRLFCWKRYYEELSHAYEREEINYEEFSSIYKEKFGVVAYLPKKEDFLAAFKKYFDIEVHYCDAYIICKCGPFILAKPKDADPWTKAVEVYKNWEYPLIPSGDEWRIINKYIRTASKKDNPKAMVLGVTPTIRDVLAKYNFSVTCVDNNPTMIRAMNEFVKVRNPSERVICEDWFNLNLDEKFDLVISDLPLPNIEFQQYNEFFSIMSRHLKDDGLFVFRTYVIPKLDDLKPCSYYAKKFRKGEIKFGDFYLLLKHHSELSPKCIINKRLYHRILFGLFDKMHSKGIFDDHEHELLNRIRHEVISKLPEIHEINDASCSYFDIRKIGIGKDFISCRDTPIFVMKKRVWPNNISEYLEKKCKDFREDTLLASVIDGRKFTFREFNQLSNQVANYIYKNVKKGDKVCILMSNMPEFFPIFYGIIKADCIAIPINYTLADSEIKEIVQGCKPRLLIMESQFSGKVDGVEKLVVDGEDSFNKLFSNTHSKLQFKSTSSFGDVAFISFSSGTTGEAKGIELAHGNLISHMELYPVAKNITRKCVWLCNQQLYYQDHLFYFGVPLSMGGTCILTKKFSRSNFWNYVKKYRVNYSLLFPTMASILLEKPEKVSRKDVRSVKYFTIGGADVPVGLIRKFESKFHVMLCEGYGLNEATGGVITNVPEFFKRKLGSMGKPLGFLDVRLVDNGNEVGEWKIGEIVVRGPTIMKGYFQDSEKTDEVLKNGWLHTGDLACYDGEGYYYFKGRVKNIIKRGGETISPKEVDDVLCKHPNVKESVTIGVKDRIYGEEVVSFVVTKKPIAEEELCGYCKKFLASFKCPKKIHFIKEIPLTHTGKPDVNELNRICA